MICSLLIRSVDVFIVTVYLRLNLNYKLMKIHFLILSILMIMSSCQYKSNSNTTDNDEIVSINKDAIKIKPKYTISYSFEETNNNYDYSFFLKTKKELDLLNRIRYNLKDSIEIEHNNEQEQVFIDSFMVITDEFNLKMHDLLSNFNSWSCPFKNLGKETGVNFE